MSEDFQIKNKIATSGLVNFDIATLLPKGKRIGIDLKDFLFQELILKEKDFREKVDLLDTEKYKDAFVYIYNSADAIVPLWAYFLLTAKLTSSAKKIMYGTQEDLEVLIWHNAVTTYNFTEMMGKRVLVKGCTEENIPLNAYIELVEHLKPIVKSLMFGEACSNVPILKN